MNGKKNKRNNSQENTISTLKQMRKQPMQVWTLVHAQLLVLLHFGKYHWGRRRQIHT